MRIGIYGGTFDPVHKKHLETVQKIKDEFNLDKIIVMPASTPPHKQGKEILADNLRLEMVKETFKNEPNVEVSEYEIDKKGKSYTVETLQRFKNLYKKDKLFFIVGYDMLLDFYSWREPSRILSFADLIVVRRGNSSNVTKERERFKFTFGKNFRLSKYVLEDISSTKIRIYAMLGLPISDYVTDSVEKIIVSKGIYKSEFGNKILSLVKPKRLRHIANVAVRALNIARREGLPYENVYLSAILHDIAKYQVDNKEYSIFYENGVEIKVPYPVAHAYLGKEIAEKEFGIKDSEILDAIKYHTSGRANMTKLEKLIYVADMLEEDRNYDGVNRLRELYYKDFEKCFIECIKGSYKLLKQKSISGEIFYETINAYNYYVKGEE